MTCALFQCLKLNCALFQPHQIELCLIPTFLQLYCAFFQCCKVKCALFQYHKMNCALFLFHQIEMCLIPLPRNWVEPNSNVSFWRGNINRSTVFAPQLKVCFWSTHVCFWSTHVCFWSSSNTPTGLYIPSLAFWSPPPSIVLDGEPETII